MVSPKQSITCILACNCCCDIQFWLPPMTDVTTTPTKIQVTSTWRRNSCTWIGVATKKHGGTVASGLAWNTTCFMLLCSSSFPMSGGKAPWLAADPAAIGHPECKRWLVGNSAVCVDVFPKTMKYDGTWWNFENLLSDLALFLLFLLCRSILVADALWGRVPCTSNLPRPTQPGERVKVRQSVVPHFVPLELFFSPISNQWRFTSFHPQNATEDRSRSHWWADAGLSRRAGARHTPNHRGLAELMWIATGPILRT